ncbi:hypothetical protein BHM03_00045256 [Ensete ventricosum]|nr:hypothetical protein BHM03_00045256 [Ensete ventricosum]
MSSCQHVDPMDDPCFRRSLPSISMESSTPFGEGRSDSVRDEGALHWLQDEDFSLVLLPPSILTFVMVVVPVHCQSTDALAMQLPLWQTTFLPVTKLSRVELRCRLDLFSSESVVDLVPRTDVASSEELPWLSVWRGLG